MADKKTPTKLEILTFPDPRLRIKAESITNMTKELERLAQDMLETMYQARGIGLAAPQVGQSVRLLVMDTRPRENGRYKPDEMTELERLAPNPLIIFNPVILK